MFSKESFTTSPYFLVFSTALVSARISFSSTTFAITLSSGGAYNSSSHILTGSQADIFSTAQLSCRESFPAISMASDTCTQPQPGGMLKSLGLYQTTSSFQECGLRSYEDCRFEVLRRVQYHFPLMFSPCGERRIPHFRNRKLCQNQYVFLSKSLLKEVSRSVIVRD